LRKRRQQPSAKHVRRDMHLTDLGVDLTLN
jgi:hypothetical protein